MGSWGKGGDGDRGESLVDLDPEPVDGPRTKGLRVGLSFQMEGRGLRFLGSQRLIGTTPL